MPRYIDADALIKRLYGMPVYSLTVLDVMHLVDDSPTEDVVEVVLCKDCKHYIKHDKRCGILNHGMKEVDFCSYGERRE